MLAAALDRWLGDPAGRALAGEAARAHVAAHHGIEAEARAREAIATLTARIAHLDRDIDREAALNRDAAEVIDRPKGYFPVPGIRHLTGGVLDLVSDTLRSKAARDRGLYRPAALDRLFADPNRIRTRLDGNELWQVALLEMWLQTMEANARR